MKFRNLIFVLMIAFSAIFIGMLGTSYAYYVTTGGVPINVGTPNIDTGAAVVFEQSQYINVNTGVPINASDVDNLASKSVFRVTPNSAILSDYHVSINIGISELYIENALRVEDFKYDFSCVNSSSIEVLSTSGNGTNTYFTDTVISNEYLQLGSLSTLNTTNPLVFDETYTCTFRVWLQENCNDITTCEDQNDLMNKKFRGLIKVNTIFKK